MPLRHRIFAVAIAVGLSACSENPPPAGKAGPSPTDAAMAQEAAGILIRARAGGQHPDRFCIPRYSIANRSGTDIGALLIDLEWRSRDGQVLQAAGEFGSLIEPFGAGREKELSLNGYSAACADLVLHIGRYACRDANAVRIPCPGTLRIDTPDSVGVDLSAAEETSMRGAVEPAQ